MANKISIPRTTDATIIRLFLSVGEKFKATRVYFHVFAIRDQVDSGSKEVLDDLVARNSALVRRAEMQFDVFHISFVRGGESNPPSPFFDELTFNENNNNQQSQFSNQNRLAITGELFSVLKVVDPDRSLAGDPSAAQARLEALHNSILEQLANAHTRQIEKNSEYLQELQADVFAKQKKLEEDFRNREEQLSERALKREEQQAAEDRRLQEKLRDIDDRQHTHARRALRGDIQSMPIPIVPAQSPAT